MKCARKCCSWVSGGAAHHQRGRTHRFLESLSESHFLLPDFCHIAGVKRLAPRTLSCAPHKQGLKMPKLHRCALLEHRQTGEGQRRIRHFGFWWAFWCVCVGGGVSLRDLRQDETSHDGFSRWGCDTLCFGVFLYEIESNPDLRLHGCEVRRKGNKAKGRKGVLRGHLTLLHHVGILKEYH